MHLIILQISHFTNNYQANNRIHKQRYKAMTTFGKLPWNIKAIWRSIQKLNSTYNIKMVLKNSYTLQRYLTSVEPQSEENMIKTVYNIVCSCSRKYKGKTNCSLKVKLKEHKKALAYGTGPDVQLWQIMSERKRNKDHQPIWNRVKITKNQYTLISPQ